MHSARLRWPFTDEYGFRRDASAGPEFSMISQRYASRAVALKSASV